MKKIILLTFAFTGLSIFSTLNVSAQGVGINSSGNPPDPSAIFDVSSTTKGQLVPRMTNTQRDAISAPAEGLLIFNTTTKCFNVYKNASWFEVCGNCILPSAATASASPTTLCEGSTLMLTGIATGAANWSWTGPNGFTSTLQSPSITSITASGSGVYTLIASNSCGAATAVNTASVNVSAPTIANAGPDINVACGASTETLAGNSPSAGTGTWSVVSGTATITTPGSPTSGVTGLAVPGTATLRWTISNAPCTTSTDDVVLNTFICPSIGNSYQGGIVAYILQPGDPGYISGQTHGLIAAPSDQSTGAAWGCAGSTISGADGTAIGTGYQNSTDIVAGCSLSGIAAKLCRDLTLGGYSDWYLPSLDELDKLYINKGAIGGFANDYYWSSTEYDNTTYASWGENFTDGSQPTLGKNDSRYVRAVRAF